MKKYVCFFCEREVSQKQIMCYGGPFALRHFCTCADCFTKHRVLHWDADPPINHFGTFVELERRILNLCESLAIDVDSPPESPLSISDILGWIGEVLWEDLGERATLPDEPVIDGTGRRSVPLFELLKARELEPEQLSIPLPPPGARIKDRDPS